MHPHRNPLSVYQRALQSFVMRVRPAGLASVIKRVLRIGRTVVDAPQGRFWVDPVSLFGAELCRDGCYEPDMERTFAEFVRPGSTVVDLGANEGYFTVMAARLSGASGRVVAVEPQDRLLAVIAENLRLNGLQDVRIVNAAISDKAGAGTIHLSPDVNSGGSGLVNAARYRLPTQPVAMRTLTEILDEQGLDHVDFMKVDIESFEWEMLAGAHETFRQKRVRAMTMEIHSDMLRVRGLDPDHLVTTLASYGYRIVKPHGHWVWVV